MRGGMRGSMKAYVLHGIGDLRYEDVAKPKPGEGTVLVAVRAAGICGSDIPRIYRTGAYSHPLIPGHEFAGIVEETGTGVDVGWLHKRVGVFPMIPCMECPQCQKRQYEMCRHYDYLGSRSDGGFAEYVRVPVGNLMELPDDVSFEQAAMLEPMAVAMHAIRGIGVRAEDSVAVCGMGAIGLLTVMFLKGMGCGDVRVMGNKDIQKRAALELGVSEREYCDTRDRDVCEWFGETGRTADVFFDCVGRKEVLAEAIQCVTPGGRVMLVGNPASDMALEKDIYWKILRKQLTLKGTWNSSFTGEPDDDWHRVMEMLQSGRVHPERLISHRFAMAKLWQGMERMRDKSEEYIKMIGEKGTGII